MIWLWTFLLSFVVVVGAVLAVAHARIAVSPQITWRATRKYAMFTGMYGGTAFGAAIALVRMWLA